MATQLLTLGEIMEVLRTTVPQLAELTEGVTPSRLHTAPDDGWSANDVLAHLRAPRRPGRPDPAHPQGVPAGVKGMNPRAWIEHTDYRQWEFGPWAEPSPDHGMPASAPCRCRKGSAPPALSRARCGNSLTRRLHGASSGSTDVSAQRSGMPPEAMWSRRLLYDWWWPQCAPNWCYGTMRAVLTTVLIVDDHAAFRTSARALLEAEGFDVIGEAADGAEAFDAVATLRPEIVLLDIQLPGLDGLAVAQQLATAPDPPAVVLISSRDATAYGSRLSETPARGFIPKSGLSGEALAALVG